MMTTSTELLNSRFGTMAHIGAGLSGRVSGLLANLAARAERRRVYAALSRLSDRELDDIGIGRADVPRIAGFTGMPALTLLARR